MCATSFLLFSHGLVFLFVRIFLLFLLARGLGDMSTRANDGGSGQVDVEKELGSTSGSSPTGTDP